MKRKTNLQKHSLAKKEACTKLIKKLKKTLLVKGQVSSGAEAICQDKGSKSKRGKK